MRRTKKKVDLPNQKTSPIMAKTIAGPKATVDRRSGRVHLMVTRSGWPAELGEAALRFEADFYAARSGLRAQRWEPRVDGGGATERLSGVDAAARIRQIEEAMDQEEFAIFTLWAALGLTISEINARGWGQKDEIGRVLQRAASRAAAVYHAGYVASPSGRILEMQKFIKEAVA